MKMAAVCGIVLLLLWGAVTSAAGSSGCDIYRTTGTNVTFDLSLQANQQHKLRWKHNDAIIFDRKGDRLYTGSVNDVYQNGSLVLTNVQKKQSGLYTPEAHTDDGMLIKGLKSTRLCVLDPVPKPKVTQKCLSSKTEVEFTCDVKMTDGVTYKWLQDGKETGDEKKTVKFKAKQVETSSFSCTASNEASQTTSDPVKQGCFNSGFVFPNKVYGVSIWVIVAGGAGIVIVLILITIVCCIRAKRKRSMRIKDEEELRLGWTNTQSQQHQHQHSHPPDHPHRQHPHHHHHHHQQQQQPAGHTGPRQQRTKQPRPRAPDPINGQPQPNPRRAQPPKPPNDDDEQPPPLPQPRKKGPKTPKV